MQNTSTKSNHTSKRHNRDAASVRAVVFEMGNLHLALPIENVYRVLNQTPVYGSGLNSVGIAHVGDQGVTVVDLHRRLFQSSIINKASQKRYLVIAQNKEGELYGIPVAAVPALMEISLSSIQVFPESYRHSNILGMASHYCHIAQAVESLTIFMLNVDLLQEV